MLNKQYHYYRYAILAVIISEILFILLCAWQIFFNLTGFHQYYDLPIYGLPLLCKLLIIVTCSLTLTVTYLIFQLLKMAKLEKELAIAKISNETAQKSIKLLRSHRHDFLNHLQVLLGYIQLDKKDAAVKYIKGIHEEVRNVSAVSGLEMPEVSILLFIKEKEAEKHGIKMEHDINTDLSNAKISQSDMVRILSNLIDNAIYELKNNTEIPEEDKYIKVSFNNIQDTLVIKVNNTCSTTINENKIFQFGYTTKGKDGSGIGLFTIKKLVEGTYRGKIQVENNPQAETTFTIFI
ncbi:MAG: Spo0B domain-containing protein [Clostridiales bacterium]|nr:Spo0B domain-containing protein [Clostridiales bacterium]MCF8022857.1 Spo0B domain-containing protein [Clostridiales bacterium]